MTNQDAKKFAEIMVGLAEVYGGQLSKPGLSLYFKALQGYSLADVERAAVAVMQTRKFTRLPTPGDLIEYLRGASDAADRGEAEAVKVLDACNRIGHWDSVVFDDPVTQAVIEALGGWQEVCLAEIDRRWWIKDFAARYAALARQGVKRFGHLPGHCEIENTRRGYEADPPVPIGDREKCRAVLAAAPKETHVIDAPAPVAGLLAEGAGQ